MESGKCENHLLGDSKIEISNPQFVGLQLGKLFGHREDFFDRGTVLKIKLSNFKETWRYFGFCLQPIRICEVLSFQFEFFA